MWTTVGLIVLLALLVWAHQVAKRKAAAWEKRHGPWWNRDECEE